MFNSSLLVSSVPLLLPQAVPAKPGTADIAYDPRYLIASNVAIHNTRIVQAVLFVIEGIGDGAGRLEAERLQKPDSDV